MNKDKPDNVIEIDDIAAFTRKLKRRQIINEISFRLLKKDEYNLSKYKIVGYEFHNTRGIKSYIQIFHKLDNLDTGHDITMYPERNNYIEHDAKEIGFKQEDIWIYSGDKVKCIDKDNKEIIGIILFDGITMYFDNFPICMLSDNYFIPIGNIHEI